MRPKRGKKKKKCDYAYAGERGTKRGHVGLIPLVKEELTVPYHPPKRPSALQFKSEQTTKRIENRHSDTCTRMFIQHHPQ